MMMVTMTAAPPTNDDDGDGAQVERIVAEQSEEEVQQLEEQRLLEGGRQPGTPDPRGPRYLVKWGGLPYGECTWETLDDVLRAGGQEAVRLAGCGIF
jgi:chromodomain-helicase-DNA-binding protein 1